MAKKKKIRTEFRKNRSSRPRKDDWTQQFAASGMQDDDSARQERVSGKGELTRRRTVRALVADDSDRGDLVLDVELKGCLRGRVLSVKGLTSTVETTEGVRYQCATRRLLKTLSTDERHVVVAGDWVLFRPAQGNEGMIERVEPRHGVLSRESKGRQHVIVANVDQLLIIASAAEPPLKANLIDRMLLTAEKSRIPPLICINKVDLVDPASLAPIVGVYSQMGYRVLLTSATTGFGVDRLKRALSNCESAVAGQSGVGKSSLLNAVEAELGLRVAPVSVESLKGRHTTTTAQLHRLTSGGYVVDTPGIRQFQLWDVSPAEIAGYFRDFRPFVSHCKYPDCTHRHEEECAVKDAVADGWLDARRYESYERLFEGLEEGA